MQKRTKRSKSIDPIKVGSILLFLFLPWAGYAQVSEGETLDRVMAVVGGEIVLNSDIEKQQEQEKNMKQQMSDLQGSSECAILERLMYRKLLLHQAKNDSVVVKDSRIDSEMDRRIRYFAKQLGSTEKLEEFYGMSIDRIKDEFRPGIKERLRIQKMRRNVTGEIGVTPSEVKDYYRKLPKDSVPLIESSVRIAHIVKKPELNDQAIRKTRKKLERFKERIESGEKSFSVMATLYSDDAIAAEEGGDLGFIERGEMSRKFEGIVFDLDSGELSEVFRTKKGFHLAQLQERRGQKVKVREILLKPEVGSEEIDRVKGELDSIAKTIRLQEDMSFKKAAKRFSDDDQTKKSGGLVVNRQSGSSNFKIEQLDPKVTFALENMEVGEISSPIPYETEDGNAYRIVKLLERTEPHKATLERDYRFLQKKAKKHKEDRMMKDWVNDKISGTYIRIDEQYRSCDFQHGWLKGAEQ